MKPLAIAFSAICALGLASVLSHEGWLPLGIALDFVPAAVLSALGVGEPFVHRSEFIPGLTYGGLCLVYGAPLVVATLLSLRALTRARAEVHSPLPPKENGPA